MITEKKQSNLKLCFQVTHNKSVSQKKYIKIELHLKIEK